MPAENNTIANDSDSLICEEVQDIISNRPHWMIRHGNILFLLVFVFLLLIACVIQYPEIVRGSVRLTASNAPKLIKAKSEGKLEKLLVANEQEVTAGQYLAFLESTGSHEQILQLKSWVDKLILDSEKSNIEQLLIKPLPVFDELGELQHTYQDFQILALETRQTFAGGFYEKKLNALQKDLRYLAALKKHTIQQKSLQEQDRQLQNREYVAYESLEKDKVIAPLELNQYKSRLLSKDQTLEQTKAQIASSEMARNNKEKEIDELQKLAWDKQQAFYSLILKLKSEIEKWMQRYIVSAPESGKLLFKSFLQSNQLVTPDDELFYVQPQQAQYYGELMAAQKGLGKLKQGQKVILRVDSYPSDEFGYLNGRVSYISSMPNRRDSFLVKIDLPNGLQTNYRKQLFFRNNLSAQGEIIIEKRSLFHQLLGQLILYTRR